MDGRLKVLQLVNEQNTLHRPVTLENISMSLPAVRSDGVPRNTGVLLSGVHGKGYKGQVEIFYNRHNLEQLFGSAGVTPNVRHNGVIDADWLIDKINAKYGLSLEAVDVLEPAIPVFEALETTKPVEIVVRDDSWNWMGTISVQTTYGNPLLETVVLVQLLPSVAHPIDMTELGNNRLSGYMCTYNFDCTAHLDKLVIDPVTGKWANFAEVLKIGQKAGLKPWYNNFVTDMPTSAVPDANPAFERVRIQTYVSGEVMGPIYFHYDLNW